MCHEDCSSRTGVIVMMNGSVIMAKSFKQKLVTKSSSEAELVALCEGGSCGLICRQFLDLQGYNVQTSVIHEDNKAVIDMIKKGHPTSYKTKHIQMRNFFMTQHVESKEFNLTWCKTGDMLADMLTKPLLAGSFTNLRDKVIGEIV